MFDQADLMEALMTKLGVKRYHILAHDYGDTVAQELLARQNEHIGCAGVAVSVLLKRRIVPGDASPEIDPEAARRSIGPLVSRLTNERSFHRKLHRRVRRSLTQPGFDELSEFGTLINYNDGVGVFHRTDRLQFANAA